MNVIGSIARFEEDGARFFMTLSDLATTREMKELYGLLLDNQQRHVAELREMMNSEVESDVESPLMARAEWVIDRYRMTMMSSDIRRMLKNDRDAFEHVLQSEEEVIRLFEGMAHAETSEKFRKIFKRLAEDEKRHLERIEGIYDFVETPGCYLEWGEFSNMRSL